MAQYKVPQDVEADDKLLGPFTFRQFIYLLIAAALAGLAVLLFKIFPFLVIIPVPFIIFLVILALPLRKDQPMETYLSAVISFYLKPHNRTWEAGEPESTILITAPKKVEENRTNNLSQEEASHRLSFLADIVDTEGYAIKNNNQLSDEINAEASSMEDIFEAPSSFNINQTLENNANTRHDQLVEQMRNAIENANSFTSNTASIQKFKDNGVEPDQFASSAVVGATPIISAHGDTLNQPAPAVSNATTTVAANLPQPGTIIQPTPVAEPSVVVPPLPTPIDDYQSMTAPTTVAPTPIPEPAPQIDSVIIQPEPLPAEPVVETAPAPAPIPEPAPEPSQNMVNLANNTEYSIETIAKQAQRIEAKENNGEVYISLH